MNTPENNISCTDPDCGGEGLTHSAGGLHPAPGMSCCKLPEVQFPKAKADTSLGRVIPITEIDLSTCQQSALDLCIQAAKEGGGRFIFITGKAGTGKSTVLREIRRRIRSVVVAPTGLAAVNVGGQTIHSFFGLPIGPLTRGRVNASKNSDIMAAAHLIIIDEVSMVRADLLDAINWSLQKSLESAEPFGGKPVVAFGDLWQLEPVVKDAEEDFIREKYRSRFFFDAQVFGGDQAELDGLGQALEIETRDLTEVFRQAGDPDFIWALNALRTGDPAGLAFLNRRYYASQPVGEKPVFLTFSNKRANTMNTTRLIQLQAEAKTYSAQVSGDFGAELPTETELTLKIGAQVMVIRNTIADDGTFVANGAVGEVIELGNDAPVVELRDGRVLTAAPASWDKLGYTYNLATDEIGEEVQGSFQQVPLKLAWAVTTHKSQGQTLDSAILELEMSAFAHGQLYVAVSRVRTFEGLYLKRKLAPKDLIVNPRVSEFFGLPIPGRCQIDVEAFA